MNGYSYDGFFFKHHVIPFQYMLYIFINIIMFNKILQLKSELGVASLSFRLSITSYLNISKQISTVASVRKNLVFGINVNADFLCCILKFLQFFVLKSKRNHNANNNKQYQHPFSLCHFSCML